MWNAASGATSYNLYYATTTGVTTSTGTKVAGLTSTSYSHTGLTNGTTYYYIVTAVNADGESAASGQVSASPSTSPLTGTWVGGEAVYYKNGNEQYLETDTYTFAIDGSYQVLEVSVPALGTASTTYYQIKGTYAISGNTLTLNRMGSRIPTSATDSTTKWDTSGGTGTQVFALSGGKAYGLSKWYNLYTAQGAVSGIVGTWVQSKDYYKHLVTFASGTYNEQFWNNFTSSGAPPDSSTSGTYTLDTNAGTVTTTQTWYYLVMGSYMAMEKVSALGAFTKQ